MGPGAIVWPHGMRFDRNGNLWLTDGRAENGNGQMIYKLTGDGTKVLMTLGTKGVSGEGPNTFNGPLTWRWRRTATSSSQMAT